MENNIIKQNKNQLKNKKNTSLEEKLKEVYKKYISLKEFETMIKEHCSELFTEKTLERIERCGGYIEFKKGLSVETLETKYRIHRGTFCNSRFCPLCSTLKARKNAYLIMGLMSNTKKIHNREFIFLTLTIPNVTGDQLNDSIQELNKSYERLIKLKQVKTICKGYIRKLEITYQGDEFITKENIKKFGGYKKNKIGDKIKSYDTYHPHIHAVISVNKSYFTDTKQYINHSTWLELWKQSTRNENITQVDIRKAKLNDINDVMEIATYSAKVSDIKNSPDVFKVLHSAMKNKRLIVFGGDFKQILKDCQNGVIEIETDGNTYNEIIATKPNDKIKSYEVISVRETEIETIPMFSPKYDEQLETIDKNTGEIKKVKKVNTGSRSANTGTLKNIAIDKILKSNNM